MRSLRLRKHREREDRFLADGIRIVEEALSLGAPVETIVYAPDLLVSERAWRVVQEQAPGRRLALSGEAFRTLSDRDDPQGIAAVVRIADCPLTSIPRSAQMLVVAACQLSDPGNLGAIIRTADAAGASAVIVVEPSVDLYDPQTVRATMGSIFALPVVRLPAAHGGVLGSAQNDSGTPLVKEGLSRGLELEGEQAFFAWLVELRAALPGVLVVASSASGDQLYSDVDYRRPVVLMVGNERHGLSPSARRAADSIVRLPMVGRGTSLNVSAATAALVYEILRQRRETLRPPCSV